MNPRPFTCDQDQIALAINLIFEPDTVAEVRALRLLKGGTGSGYFDGEHRSEMAQFAEECSGNAMGVYFTLNPVDPTLLARAFNRGKRYSVFTTKDSEILRRRWLPIDFDPKRPSGISSTAFEHQAAIDRARECRDWLRGRGFPDPILADSGNGGHLLYGIDLPNDQESTDYVRGVLNTVADRFSDAVVEVDRSVFNAARIWTAYGTLAMKGDSTPERPHRIARILEYPR
jgi:hypothetical protein